MGRIGMVSETAKATGQSSHARHDIPLVEVRELTEILGELNRTKPNTRVVHYNIGYVNSANLVMHSRTEIRAFGAAVQPRWD